MNDSAPRPLCDRVLNDCKLAHGFGVKGFQAPDPTAFSRQVHGIRVVEAARWGHNERPKADAILSLPDQPRVGIVTADCVPILAAAQDGSCVVAIHAGWRGLAFGVIEAALAALVARADDQPLVAAVGPAARGCCYEVDAPVRTALEVAYRDRLDAEVLATGRLGHYQLDLPLLATRILEGAGISSDRLGLEHRVCTICDRDRFESYRRDGDRAGRLAHFITARGRNPSGVDSLQARP